jgi:hypothetical protein
MEIIMWKKLLKRLQCKHPIQFQYIRRIKRMQLTNPWSSESGWTEEVREITYCQNCGKSTNGKWKIIRTSEYGMGPQ